MRQCIKILVENVLDNAVRSQLRCAIKIFHSSMRANPHALCQTERRLGCTLVTVVRVGRIVPNRDRNGTGAIFQRNFRPGRLLVDINDLTNQRHRTNLNTINLVLVGLLIKLGLENLLNGTRGRARVLVL